MGRYRDNEYSKRYKSNKTKYITIIVYRYMYSHCELAIWERADRTFNIDMFIYSCIDSYKRYTKKS